MNYRALGVFVAFASSCGVGVQDIEATSAALALEWVAPEDGEVFAGDIVELAVMTNEPKAARVRFEVNGVELSVCEPSLQDEDCRRGDQWRWTTALSEGRQLLRATLTTSDGLVQSIERFLIIGAAPLDEDRGGEGPGGQTTQPLTALTIDPDRGYHSVFGGISWAVQSQRVELRTGRPEGTVSSISACLNRYGSSIRSWADRLSISRASVVATAITESNCTNPAGSSDGLSSGPMQVTASTCSSVTGLSRTTCRTRMHANPDFSFEVGVRYMASSYQRRQHEQDPPKIAAAYNAGSVRRSSANRWHMVSTGNHIDRFVRAYNAYRAWDLSASLGFESSDEVAPPQLFEGENVSEVSALPTEAAEGQVYFVGDFARRDGEFYVRRGGTWVLN